jgi:hypothetical protein
MPNRRRDFFKDLLAIGALQSVAVLPISTGMMAALLGQDSARDTNPEFDADAYNFWAAFLSSDAEPITSSAGQARGKRSGLTADNENQPIFLHHGTEGFKNAAELDPSQLAPEGDVMISVNTSTIKSGLEDQAIFEKLQNAQLRVDIAQKTAILPIVEAMAYTVVAGMRSVQSQATSAQKGAATKPKITIQNVSLDSDTAWQKMQNIPLPGGEGRWAFNLEAQKKDSLFGKVLQNLLKETGLFAPVIGLPGIVMSALQSFNLLYGAMHAQPVSIMKGNPVRVFATQEAYQKTGAPGSVTGILLQSGTYIVIPAKQLPPPKQLDELTVMQGRVVPPKTSIEALDAVAADTLKDVTYATFDVEVTPTALVTSSAPKKSA